MGWATNYITKLQAGKSVSFRKRRHTMSGLIELGQLCTVEPIQDYSLLKVGDIVLCVVGNSEYLHLIKAINAQRFQVGNNRAGVNEWIDANHLYGKCVKVEAWDGL